MDINHLPFHPIPFAPRISLIQQQGIQELLSSDRCQAVTSETVAFHDLHGAFKCTLQEKRALAAAVSFYV
jgi:hypothetical protein